MKVRAIGLMEFTIESAKNSKQLYRVDLLAYDCRGRCDCADYMCRREKLVARGESTQTCKHCKAAREWALDDMLHRIANDQIEKRRPNPKPYNYAEEI